MQPVDRKGQFRAQITDYGLTESKDGAVGITLKVKLLEWFDLTAKDENGEQGAWIPWEQYDMQAEGTAWVVKKTGEMNELGAKSLISFAGWDANLESVANGSWQPTLCQVAVDEEEYKGVTRRKISFVNDYNRNPLGMGSVAPGKAKELQGRFGAQLRALAGNAKRNAPSANGPIPAPPPARQPAMAVSNPDADEPPHDPNNIPY